MDKVEELVKNKMQGKIGDGKKGGRRMWNQRHRMVESWPPWGEKEKRRAAGKLRRGAV